MAKRDKLLKKIQNNPRQVSFHDLMQLLEYFGFEFDHATGSHHIFIGRVHDQKVRISIPFRRGVLHENYVREVLKLIEKMSEDQEQ